MDSIPAGMTDILHPLALAGILIVILADRSRKDPAWLRWLVVLLLLLCAGILISGRHWLVPRRIGDPVQIGLAVAVIAAALFLLFRFVRDRLAERAKSPEA